MNDYEYPFGVPGADFDAQTERIVSLSSRLE